MSTPDDLQGLFEPTGSKDEFGELFSNWGMLIPLACFKDPMPKKISTRKRIICSIFGHQWGSSGMSFTTISKDSRHHRLCKRCGKEKWVKRIRSYKWIDTLLMPLCFIRIHRWKGTYSFRRFCYGPNCNPPQIEDHYQCVRCKKLKTVIK